MENKKKEENNINTEKKAIKISDTVWIQRTKPSNIYIHIKKIELKQMNKQKIFCELIVTS